LWIGMVVAFLTLQVLLGVASVVLATNDLSWSVVPEYHAGAMKWDEQRAIQRASDELGWKHEVTIDPAADAMGNRAVRVYLADKTGEPVLVDRMEGSIFHHARGAQMIRFEMTRGGRPGVYEAQVRMRRPGLWEMRFSADRGKEHWQAKVQQELAESR
jgi:nitrogen fixation protein FixH